MMPLAMAPENRPLTIQRLGGSGPRKKFIEGLGFTAGAGITVLSKTGDSMIVSVRGTRVAVNKEIALKIYITEEVFS